MVTTNHSGIYVVTAVNGSIANVVDTVEVLAGRLEAEMRRRGGKGALSFENDRITVERPDPVTARILRQKLGRHASDLDVDLEMDFFPVESYAGTLEELLRRNKKMRLVMSTRGFEEISEMEEELQKAHPEFDSDYIAALVGQVFEREWHPRSSVGEILDLSRRSVRAHASQGHFRTKLMNYGVAYPADEIYEFIVEVPRVNRWRVAEQTPNPKLNGDPEVLRKEALKRHPEFSQRIVWAVSEPYHDKMEAAEILASSPPRIRDYLRKGYLGFKEPNGEEYIITSAEILRFMAETDREPTWGVEMRKRGKTADQLGLVSYAGGSNQPFVL